MTKQPFIGFMPIPPITQRGKLLSFPGPQRRKPATVTVLRAEHEGTFRSQAVRSPIVAYFDCSGCGATHSEDEVLRLRGQTCCPKTKRPIVAPDD